MARAVTLVRFSLKCHRRSANSGLLAQGLTPSSSVESDPSADQRRRPPMRPRLKPPIRLKPSARNPPNERALSSPSSLAPVTG